MLNGESTSVFYHLRSPLKPAGERPVDMVCALSFSMLSKERLEQSRHGFFQSCPASCLYSYTLIIQTADLLLSSNL